MSDIVPHDPLPTEVRTYGALATRLTEALGRARTALDAHCVHLPDGTLGGLEALLAEFERRRVRIAVYGEVKAGKSTLLNAVAGAALSPAAFEPLTAVPVRVTYGPQTAWRVGERWLDSVAALEAFMRSNPAPSDEVVVQTNLDLLQLGGQVDLLDTPGVGSETTYDAITSDVLRSLDAVVLVVRYPALFTQFTRHLMQGLEADIGKLFVVWNLDAACAELSPEERTRHADRLRANVAGAHDLFLVDARAAYHAATSGDGGALAASGANEFRAALAHFAASGARDLTAVREASKRAQRWLADARPRLAERQASLERDIRDAQEQVRRVQTAAEDETRSARTRLADFDTAASGAVQRGTAAAAARAGELRSALRRARRAWMRRGDRGALESAVSEAVERYATGVEDASRTVHQAILADAAAFGTSFDAVPRERIAPAVGPLAPDDRHERAASGRLPMLRRALWARWYLPGLAALEADGVPADLAAQASWAESLLAASRAAAGGTLAQRLAEITARTEAELARIRAETNLDANEVEFARLSSDVPVVAAQAESLAQIGAEARALL